MKMHGLLLYQDENYMSRGRVLDREENYVQTLAHVSVESPARLNEVNRLVKESPCPLKLFHFILKGACSISRSYTAPTIGDVTCVTQNCVVAPSQENARSV
jgi:hypothetical protein